MISDKHRMNLDVIYVCPGNDPIFSFLSNRCCPICQQKYIATDKDAIDLIIHGYIVVFDESEKLFNNPYGTSCNGKDSEKGKTNPNVNDEDTLTLDDDVEGNPSPEDIKKKIDRYFESQGYTDSWIDYS